MIGFGAPAHLGYVALGGLIGLESMGLPLPGEAALIGSAVLAHQGRLSIVVVIAVAAIAAIAGDNIGYAIGARGGRKLLERDGRFAAQRRRFLERGERFFKRHGPKAVFLARWVVGARVTAAWLAGVNGMPWRRFLAYNAAGGVLWAISVGSAGYVLGAAGAKLVERAGIAALAALLLVAGLALLVHRRRARQHGAVA